VQEWSEATTRVLREYWGPLGQILRSLVDRVNLPELKQEMFDLSAFPNVFFVFELYPKTIGIEIPEKLDSGRSSEEGDGVMVRIFGTFKNLAT